MANILLIDDDREFCEFLQSQLTDLGHQVTKFELAEDALEVLVSNMRFDLVLLDNKMPRMTGIEFLVALKRMDVEVPVILMTSDHHDQTVLDAINNGAADYAIKPDDFENILDELGPLIEETLRLGRPPKRVNLEGQAEHRAKDDSTIVGHSKPILQVLKAIGRVAKLDETVLILGETGTGKDLVARAIHTNSRRKDKPFVVLNCTAFNENLLDDEMFGHEVGAFTGAVKLRKGRFEHAHGGTLFLDEVGDMPLALQAKLLRVLENREVVRIGSNEPIKVDVRVVAATHRNLRARVEEGKFREDLVYRLDGLTIALPPLRERKEDIKLLADRFLGPLLDDTNIAPLHPGALERLQQYHWPGNVRQLQKVLLRALADCRGSQIMPEDLQFGEFDRMEPTPVHSVSNLLQEAIVHAWESEQTDLFPYLKERLERLLLQHALDENRKQGLSQDELAERLGMARATLWKRIKEYGLQDLASGHG